MKTVIKARADLFALTLMVATALCFSAKGSTLCQQLMSAKAPGSIQMSYLVKPREVRKNSRYVSDFVHETKSEAPPKEKLLV